MKQTNELKTNDINNFKGIDICKPYNERFSPFNVLISLFKE